MEPGFKNQTEAVLDWLKHQGPLTPLDALKHLGVGALSQRIGDLKRQGVHIESRRVNVAPRKWVSRYFLPDPPDTAPVSLATLNPITTPPQTATST